jgi:chitinase
VLQRRLRVVVSWSAATDDVGVAGYRVYRNGRLLASLGRRSLTDRAIARGRTYRYAVRAYDAAGNVGAARAVTIRTPRR